MKMIAYSILLAVMLTLNPMPEESPPTYQTYDLNYTMDTSNSIICDNKVWGYELYDEEYGNGKGCSKEILDEILDNIEFNFKKEFTVHLLNRHSSVLGLASQDGKTMVIFDAGGADDFDVYEPIVLHELGHLVYANLTDKQVNEWKKFRGIPEDWTDYNRSKTKPTEIFAKDFVYLFGINYKDEIGPQGYPRPDKVDGLKEYVISLGGE